MKTQRIEWIDILKGIGIILVVIGHSNYIFANYSRTMFIQKYIYSFHMPLFFFLSGFLFKINKYNDIKSFIKVKAKTLLVPYLFFSLFSLLISSINLLLHHQMIFDLKLIISQIMFLQKKVIWNEPLWFLLCLFIVEILYFAIIKTKVKVLFILLLSALLGCILSIISKYFVLPFGLGIAFTAIFFYGIGNLMSSSNLTNIANNSNKIIFVISLLTSTILGGYLNTIVILYEMNYGNFFYFYIASFAGIISYIHISKFIYKYNIFTSVFRYLGKNSLIILCTHYIIFFILQRLSFLNLTFRNFISIRGYIYAIITLLTSLPIIYLINNYFPWILGKPSSNLFNNKKNTFIPKK